ncbi:MAG TPA: ABC transporter permease [Bryobacteraceae bacterium]|jgi:putative ABC transport system permease protein|nr:ABC transporter permease [Bryobacteraceae bacterium]
MTWLNELLADLRYGLHGLRKEPGFTLAVLMALALGIGANTAIFTVARVALLKPLPYPDSDQIMMVWESVRERGWDQFPVSVPDFLDWRRDANLFATIAGFTEGGFNLRTGEGAERIDAVQVTDGFFDVIGIRPRIGRPILPEDTKDDGRAVAILTDSLWKRSFGADPNAIGHKIALDGKPFTIIGVMPVDFQRLTGKEQIYTPLVFSPEQRANRGSHSFLAVGRLKPGVVVEAARVQIGGIAQRIANDSPNTNRGFSVSLVPFAEQAVQEIKPLVLILWGTVGVVLLIACANVANLLLARGQIRRREFAIRTAIGARRGRILRQLLAESTLLSVLGGALGLLPALWGTDLLTRTGIEDFPTLQDVKPDLTVALFALGISLLTGVLFGIIPALNLARIEVGEALKNLNAATAGGSLRHKARSLFIVAEVALSLVLLVGAGLLLRSLIHLRFTGPGFQPDSVLTMSLTLGDDKYDRAERMASFIDRYLQEARALPGVQFAAAGNTVPLMSNLNISGVQIENMPRDPKDGAAAARMKASPDYFRALGIPIKRGRAFSDTDRRGAQPVVVINETFARRYFNGQDPIGKRMRLGSRAMREIPWMTVVGVVGDVRASRMTAKVGATFYMPIAQEPESSLALVVRTTIPPEQIAEPMRKLVLGLDPDEPVYGVQTMNQVVATSIASERVATILVTGFASLAVMLALMGIYSVVSYSVVSRTREIGIRMALGAQASDVMSVLIKQALALVGIGIAIGIAGAYGISRALTSLLHGVSPTDPATFAVTLALMAIAATLASFIPARRALRLDPTRALRQD